MQSFPVEVPWEPVPDVHPAGISFLTALTEVRHPAVVSETADCDDVGALATAGTLVDFVMFVERRARFATLVEMKNKKTTKARRWRGNKLQADLNITLWMTNLVKQKSEISSHLHQMVDLYVCQLLNLEMKQRLVIAHRPKRLRATQAYTAKKQKKSKVNDLKD